MLALVLMWMMVAVKQAGIKQAAAAQAGVKYAVVDLVGVEFYYWWLTAMVCALAMAA
jgi:hypothetical protein